MIQQELHFLKAEALAIAPRFPPSARCTNVYAIRTDSVKFLGSLGTRLLSDVEGLVLNHHGKGI